MKKIFLAVASTFLLMACSNDDNGSDNCTSYADAYVDSVEEVTTADAAGFLFKVRFSVINGCGDFNSFKEIASGNVRTVTVEAKYEGCICDTALHTKEAVYNFKPTAPGTYTIKFRNTEDTFITETVTIE